MGHKPAVHHVKVATNWGFLRQQRRPPEPRCHPSPASDATDGAHSQHRPACAGRPGGRCRRPGCGGRRGGGRGRQVPAAWHRTLQCRPATGGPPRRAGRRPLEADAAHVSVPAGRQLTAPPTAATLAGVGHQTETGPDTGVRFERQTGQGNRRSPPGERS